MDEPRIKISWSLIVQVVVYVVTIMLAYGSLNERLALVEMKNERQSQDIREIKDDVKSLLRRP